MSTQAVRPNDITQTFEDAVRAYLHDKKGLFNYELLVKNHTDSSRFGPWVAQADHYRSVKGATILSSGCGSGGDIAEFLAQGAAAVHGIEVDSELIELAKKRFVGDERTERISLKTYDGNRLPYAPNSFDIVFSLHVIEHTKNVGLYLSEIFRVLKLGGILFLDLPNRYYKYEQHINLPYIHHIPRPLRNIVVRVMLNKLFPIKLNNENRFKIATMHNCHIPSPRRIVDSVRGCPGEMGLFIEDAFFHSYDNNTLPYDQAVCGYYHGDARRHTTFRIVVRKREGGIVG